MTERYWVSGRSKLVAQTLQQIVLMRQIVNERDIGTFLGYPEWDYQNLGVKSLKLQIFLHSLPQPPYTRRRDPNLTRVQISIPLPSRGKLTWQNIKNAVGGVNGYMWGRWLTTTHLSNGFQVQVYGGTKKESQDIMNTVLTLQNSEVLTQSTKEELKQGRRAVNRGMYKKPTRVYPSWFTIIHQQKILAENRGRASLSGNFREIKSPKIELHHERAPQGTRDVIREVLRIRGQDELI